jgi:hypothetical protein
MAAASASWDGEGRPSAGLWTARPTNQLDVNNPLSNVREGTLGFGKQRFLPEAGVFLLRKET